jgi:phosphoglycerol transferase MdoB-like AlkP superfamily enzyme
MKALVIIGGIFLIIVSFIVDGLVLSILWKWFIVSIFNLPLLTIPSALGLSFLISYMKPYKKDGLKKEDLAEAITAAIVQPIIFLLLGYIVHLFI